MDSRSCRYSVAAISCGYIKVGVKDSGEDFVPMTNLSYTGKLQLLVAFADHDASLWANYLLPLAAYTQDYEDN